VYRNFWFWCLWFGEHDAVGLDATANFCTIKHMAQNLVRRAPGKTSMRQKRKAAAWDDDCLASLIAQ